MLQQRKSLVLDVEVPTILAEDLPQVERPLPGLRTPSGSPTHRQPLEATPSLLHPVPEGSEALEDAWGRQRPAGAPVSGAQPDQDL